MALRIGLIAFRNTFGGLAALSALASGHSANAADAGTLVEQGAYLVRAAGCLACHTDIKNEGAAYAGGRALETPFGVFYSPNITPDVETGIGGWSDADFITALRSGESPEGHLYYPVFPFPSYTKMRDEDMLAIKAYLFSLDPVQAENKEHDADFPLGWRFLLNGWALFNFEEGPMADDPDQDDTWNRGRYLVDALAHCGECHTPRGLTGGVDNSRYLAGNPEGPDEELVPNITPHATGLADWSEGDIVQLLRDGMKPDFDDVQGSMSEAIEDGLTHLTEEDLSAIASYLKSVPAIDNIVKK